MVNDSRTTKYIKRQLSLLKGFYPSILTSTELIDDITGMVAKYYDLLHASSPGSSAESTHHVAMSNGENKHRSNSESLPDNPAISNVCASATFTSSSDNASVGGVNKTNCMMNPVSCAENVAQNNGSDVLHTIVINPQQPIGIRCDKFLKVNATTSSLNHWYISQINTPRNSQNQHFQSNDAILQIGSHLVKEEYVQEEYVAKLIAEYKDQGYSKLPIVIARCRRVLYMDILQPLDVTLVKQSEDGMEVCWEVGDVTAGRQAWRLGICSGDIILSIGGEEINAEKDNQFETMLKKARQQKKKALLAGKVGAGMLELKVAKKYTGTLNGPELTSKGLHGNSNKKVSNDDLMNKNSCKKVDDGNVKKSKAIKEKGAKVFNPIIIDSSQSDSDEVSNLELSSSIIPETLKAGVRMAKLEIAEKYTAVHDRSTLQPKRAYDSIYGKMNNEDKVSMKRTKRIGGKYAKKSVAKKSIAKKSIAKKSIAKINKIAKVSDPITIHSLQSDSNKVTTSALAGSSTPQSKHYKRSQRVRRSVHSKCALIMEDDPFKSRGTYSCSGDTIYLTYTRNLRAGQCSENPIIKCAVIPSETSPPIECKSMGDAPRNCCLRTRVLQMRKVLNFVNDRVEEICEDLCLLPLSATHLLPASTGKKCDISSADEHWRELYEDWGFSCFQCNGDAIPSPRNLSALVFDHLRNEFMAASPSHSCPSYKFSFDSVSQNMNKNGLNSVKTANDGTSDMSGDLNINRRSCCVTKKKLWVRNGFEYHKLSGVQPWMITRRLVLKLAQDMLIAHGCDSWLNSLERMQCLGESRIPIIRTLMIQWTEFNYSTWKSSLESGKINLYATEIWRQYLLCNRSMKTSNQQFRTMEGKRVSQSNDCCDSSDFDGFIRTNRFCVTENFVLSTFSRLQKEGFTTPIAASQLPFQPQLVKKAVQLNVSEKKALILDILYSKKYVFLPFVTSFIEMKEIAELIFSRLLMHNLTANNMEKDINPQSLWNVLDDFEDEDYFLTRKNEFLKVRVKVSRIPALMKKTEIKASNYGKDKEASEMKTFYALDVNAKTSSSLLPPPAKSKLNPSVSGTKTVLGSNHDLKEHSPQKDKSNELPCLPKSTNNQHAPQRKLSVSKNIGSRVYAEFTNSDYYWGFVKDVKKTDDGKKVYCVEFEDGDILAKIPGKSIFTEIDYINCFESKPPACCPEAFKRNDLRLTQTHDLNCPDNAASNSDLKRMHEDVDASLNENGNSNEDIKHLTDICANHDARTNDCKRPKRAITSKSTAENNEHFFDSASTSVSLSSSNALHSSNLIISANEDFNLLSASELLEYGCNLCEFCRKGDCGKCYTCIKNNNLGFGMRRGACLRKVCGKIVQSQRLQVAPGFPRGWKFLFDSPQNVPSIEQRSISPVTISNEKTSMRNEEKTQQKQNHIKGLVIFSPKGRKFRNVVDTKCDLTRIRTIFLPFIGIRENCYSLMSSGSFLQNVAHFLVGRGYLHEWTDVNGRRKLVVGKVTICEKDLNEKYKTDDDESLTFTILYDNHYCKIINEFPPIPQDQLCAVPESRTVKSDCAWGGCIAFERWISTPDLGCMPSLFCKFETDGKKSVIKGWDKNIGVKTWVVPDERWEEILTGGGCGPGLDMLPRTTLLVRGFKVVLMVKQSSIPNSGYGAFMKVTPLVSYKDSPRKFFLRPGELLDIGVYTPFCATDRKKEVVFKLKNYIHSREPEEWCFDTIDDNTTYDITDEISGGVHSIARNHIPMYINEVKRELNTEKEICLSSSPNIYAAHDPEGSVHYLFGIPHDGESDEFEENFKELQAPLMRGEEIELYVDYGEEYERVRLRKNYSVLAPLLNDKKGRKVLGERIKLLEDDTEDDYLDDINEFTREELMSTIDYFTNIFLQALAECNKENHTKKKSLTMEAKSRILLVVDRIERRARTLLQGKNQDFVLSSAQTIKYTIEKVRETQCSLHSV
eukprot:CAMPEP_0194365126 /NCGR_PEP_ID=MMETSP0174-20130528/13117_1 /TAXON_ID=216777 /ORGANISM="Proboscia alata, Strain PI-D3" /LENGTH=1950 /DNA_ID=CAMNT_0039139609 /DNA_START=8 /DNA_END=5860 /DNA_ORIENTATION=-